MEVEPLACGISGEQNGAAAVDEIAERLGALGAIETAVQHCGWCADGRAQLHESVPVLGEDDDRLMDTIEKSDERRDFGFVPRGLPRGCGELAEHRVLARGIPKRQIGQIGRSIGIVCVVVGIRKRQHWLPRGDCGPGRMRGVRLQRRQTPLDRFGERPLDSARLLSTAMASHLDASC